MTVEEENNKIFIIKIKIYTNNKIWTQDFTLV